MNTQCRIHGTHIIRDRSSNPTGMGNILDRRHTGLMRRKATHKRSHLMIVLTNSAIAVRGAISSSTSLLPSREPVIATSAWYFGRNARSPAAGDRDASVAWTIVWHLFPASIIRHAEVTLDPTFTRKLQVDTVAITRKAVRYTYVHGASIFEEAEFVLDSILIRPSIVFHWVPMENTRGAHVHT